MFSIKKSGGEKWGKSCTHSVRRAHDTTSHHTPQHHPDEALFIAIAAILRGLGALREQHTPSRGGQWGAGWGTPGSGMGSIVEQPRGAGWGALWSSPGESDGEPWGARWSNTERSTQHHRARNQVGRSGRPSQPAIAFDEERSGAPRSPGAPHSRELCAYDVSRRPCDYPSVVPDPE